MPDDLADKGADAVDAFDDAVADAAATDVGQDVPDDVEDEGSDDGACSELSASPKNSSVR